MTFYSAASGVPTQIPGVWNVETLGPDTDGDGLEDAIENVLGTNPGKPDSDGDGVKDGAEVAAGNDPNDGRPILTGIIAASPAPGTATDVVTANDLAFVALGDGGLGVFNIFNGLNPVLIAQVDTPGTANAVASDGSIATVADGTSGLAIIDISQPANASIVRQVVLGGTAWAVTAAHGTAYVGTRENELVAVDLQTGVIRKTISFSSPVNDVLVTGNTLYVALQNELQAFRADRPSLELLVLRQSSNEG